MRITIIGAGFTGSVLAIELARQAVAGVSISLVGVPETFGRGVAYGEARLEHLLNVRARDLGATRDYPGEFADWLHLTERARDAFLPRLVYGEYLHSRLHSAEQLAEAAVTRVEQEAIAVERVGRDAFRVHLADGTAFLSDSVVLAVGALPPQPLTGVGPRLALDPSYIGWPWQERAIDRIAPDARVLVVGSGLTMADVAATLKRRAHRGAITVLSRHGLWPLAQAEQRHEPIALPPGVLHALNRHDLRGVLRSLRALAPIVSDWRGLVDALRPYLQDFWRHLPEPQRRRFLRHLRPYWDVVRHRLAPSVAAELAALRDSGQLQLLAGRLVRARRGEGAVEVSLLERGSNTIRNERYDVLVRATGLDTDFARTTHPLMANLRDAGLLSADALGLGVETNDRWEAIDRQGRAVRGLYVLGPLLRARLWEITAIPELRNAAHALARQLLVPGWRAPGVEARARTPAWRQ